MYVRSYDLCESCKNIQREDIGTVGDQLDSVNVDLNAIIVYRENISELKEHGRNSGTCDCIGLLEHAISRLWEK